MPDLTWAVIDTGIDATHRAFLDSTSEKNYKPGDAIAPGDSRVKASYDFTRLRKLITLDSHPSTGPSALDQGVDLEEADRRFKEMRLRLRSGKALDWVQLEPLLRIRHEADLYRPPAHDHGTHVAGILGAGETTPKDGQGMCPDINLYDLRVLDERGRGDEFSIIAALQFVRYLNATADRPVIHGVNLSLSLIHDVENFACGRTPICEECERLVASGVVVVAAAGNRGFERVLTGAGELDAYRAHQHHRPGKRRRRHHRGGHASLRAAHLRRQLLLEPRPDGRRAHQARRAGARRADLLHACSATPTTPRTAPAWRRRT